MAVNANRRRRRSCLWLTLGAFGGCFVFACDERRREKKRMVRQCSASPDAAHRPSGAVAGAVVRTKSAVASLAVLPDNVVLGGELGEEDDREDRPHVARLPPVLARCGPALLGVGLAFPLDLCTIIVAGSRTDARTQGSAPRSTCPSWWRRR